MHDEKRGERYFSMHRLTGAELTKLISKSLLDRNAGLGTSSLHERRRILSQVHKPVKQESFFVASSKLKLNLRLATLPCYFISIGTRTDHCFITQQQIWERIDRLIVYADFVMKVWPSRSSG